MQIREASEKDIPYIVDLLSLSMGDSSELPVSIDVWKYKHIENPFGKSHVLIAEENEKIIGLRAFMYWQWQKNKKIFKAYRAVDTATHPEFQGRGIFKKLTLKAVEDGVNSGMEYIFNTPNDLSRPGYLKMGWIEAGKLKVGLKPYLKGFLKFSSENISYKQSHENSSFKRLEELCHHWNMQLVKSGRLFTPKSPQYLNWRYEENPLQNYEVLDSHQFYMAGCIKKRGKLKELRITECLFIDNKHLKEIKFIINQWAKRFGVHIISFSPQLLPLKSFIYQGNIGPILTVKNLNCSSQELESLLQIDNWYYSLGDLELF